MYTASFCDDDGTLLQTVSVEYGKEAIYTGAIPTVQDWYPYRFTFAGWDNDTSAIYEDTVFTAQYSIEVYGAITINNKDELESDWNGDDGTRTISPSLGEDIDVTKALEAGELKITSVGTCCSVDGFVITPLGLGSQFIDISYRGLSASIKIHITKMTLPSYPAAITVSSPDGKSTIIVGATTQLTAVVAPEGADQSVTWLSSDESVAQVDAHGLVTAISIGMADISATSTIDETVYGGFNVNVVDKVVEEPDYTPLSLKEVIDLEDGTPTAAYLTSCTVKS